MNKISRRNFIRASALSALGAAAAGALSGCSNNAASSAAASSVASSAAASEQPAAAASAITWDDIFATSYSQANRGSNPDAKAPETPEEYIEQKGNGDIMGSMMVGMVDSLNIPEEHFFPWSPDTPFLYDLTVGTNQGEEAEFDTVHSYFALRKWSCAPDAQGVLRFCLNDKPILLNGLLDQGYWPEGLYTPPSDAAVERELSEVKALGFNLLRKHAKIEPQRWYYHCDRLGLIVWQDIVNGGSAYNLWFVTYLTNVLQPLLRRFPDGKACRGLLSRAKPAGREEYAHELADTVQALRCHPCIACWVPFNEGWGQFDAGKAVQALRTLDGTRLVDEASGWFDQGGGDVHSLHNYFYPLRIRPQKRTVALSEYGGIAWPMPGHEPPRKTYGYGTAKDRQELTARYKKLQLKTVLPQLEKGLSALVYTQLTDVEDEVNGLFTYDRAAVKPDANAVRSVNAALAAEFARVTNPAKK